MSDIALNISLNDADLQRAFKEAERATVAATRRMQQQITAQLARLDKAFKDSINSTDTFANAQRQAGRQAAQAASQINDEQIKQASEKWRALTTAVSAAIGSFIAVKATSREVEVQQESSIQSLTRLARAYLGLRGAISGVAGILRTGIDFERQRTQLQGLFQSVAQGNQAFQWLRDFPIQAQGFDQALQTLKGFGAPDLFNTLTKINDATLTLGDSGDRIGRIALALGQGFAANTLRAEELNQLIDAGIPVYDLFEEKLGLTAIQVRDLAAAGRLGRKEIQGLVDAIGERFAGGAERSLDSVSGLLVAIQKQFEKFIGSIADAGLLDFVRSQLRAFFDEVQRLKETGELDAIAQNISNFLTGLARGFAAIGRQIGIGLKQFFQTESLENFGELAEAALFRVAEGVRVLIDNFKLITTAVSGFLALKFSVVLALQVAAFSGLAFTLIKYHAELIAATTATAKFIAAQLSSSTVGRALIATLFGIRTALFANAIAFGVAFGAIGLAIGGLTLLINRFFDSAEAARRLQEQLEADTRALKEFRDIQDDLSQKGLEAIVDQIGQIRQARNLEQISTKEALALARERFRVATDLLTQISNKEREVANLRSQLEKQVADEAIQARIDVLQSAIETNRTELQTRKQQLADALRAEKQFTNQAINLRKQLADNQIATEDRIKDIQRSSESESSKQFSIKLELLQLEREISKQVLEAKEAETQAEREAAIEQAKNRQARAESLAEQLTDETDAVQTLKKLGDTKNKITQAEIDANEQAAKAERDKAATLKKSIAESEQTIKALQDQVDKLKEPVSVDIKADLSEAEKGLADLRDKLRELEKNPPVIRPRVEGPGFNQGGPVSLFSTGGRVFGPSGADVIQARLTAGEFVIRKAAVERYGLAFMQAINSMRLPALPTIPTVQKMSRLASYPMPAALPAPPGVQRFQNGGLARPSKTEVVEIKVQAGNRRVNGLYGDREAANSLISVLNEVARAEL